MCPLLNLATRKTYEIPRFRQRSQLSRREKIYSPMIYFGTSECCLKQQWFIPRTSAFYSCIRPLVDYFFIFVFLQDLKWRERFFLPLSIGVNFYDQLVAKPFVGTLCFMAYWKYCIKGLYIAMGSVLLVMSILYDERMESLSYGTQVNGEHRNTWEKRLWMTNITFF